MNVSLSAMLRPKDTKQAEVKITRRSKEWHRVD
jgi:hypothetical protein